VWPGTLDVGPSRSTPHVATSAPGTTQTGTGTAHHTWCECECPYPAASKQHMAREQRECELRERVSALVEARFGSEYRAAFADYAIPGHRQVDGHDPVLELTDTAEVLALNPGRLVALLDGAGLVHNAHRPAPVVGQRDHDPGQVLLEMRRGRPSRTS
jgi:hypothetical protein